MEIRLKFLGAAQCVTGSRYLLDADGVRLLVDCGLYQERELQSRNWGPFPAPPSSIGAVLLTHAHLDHCGYFPKLYRDGFRGRAWCTPATAEIAGIVLADSGRLQEEDAAFKRARHESEGRRAKHPEVALYTADDAAACASAFSPVRYGEPVRLGDGVEAVFANVGHVLGASFITVAVRRNGEERRIVFSGDVGRWDAPILQAPALPARADYVLIESTYGDRLHPSREEAYDALADVINRTHDAGGNVVIPTFALERTQDLLFALGELLRQRRIPHLLVFLDGPEAIRISEVFQRHPELYDPKMSKLVNGKESPFDLPGLTLTRTRDESKAVNHLRGAAVIMAGSGMCTGGRIKHHLAHNISQPESAVAFVGYQAAGTLGRQIVDGAKEVRILGRTFPVKARIVQISGFSGHADRDELLKWLSGLATPPKKTFVVHGEPDSARSLAGRINQKPGWTALAPAYGDEVALD